MAIAQPTPAAAPTQDTIALLRLHEAESGMRPADVEPGRYFSVRLDGEDVLLAITGDVCHVGRSPACDIVLEDPSVSRRHAVVTRRNGRSVILDDRSLNGVQVDGRRVAEAVLHDGDLLALGRVVVRYVEVQPDGAAPA